MIDYAIDGDTIIIYDTFTNNFLRLDIKKFIEELQSKKQSYRQLEFNFKETKK